MKSLFANVVAFLLVFVFVCSPVWATCGGGGGGGGGGTSGSGGNGGGSTANPVVYHVPWNNPKTSKSAPATEGLILYWFPATKEEIQKIQLARIACVVALRRPVRRHEFSGYGNS